MRCDYPHSHLRASYTLLSLNGTSPSLGQGSASIPAQVNMDRLLEGSLLRLRPIRLLPLAEPLHP